MTTINDELEKLWEHNRAFLGVQAREVQVERAGGFYRARYKGEAMSCLGRTSKEATSRLRFWEEP
jgi:hypothetical protein